MAVDCTVVVPVWNPGDYIEPLISSLLAQTWPADQLELLFVDDGATDDTPARLDRLAADHRQVRVIHQENSGWPGKPRNVGTDAAQGTYVFYVDQDDHLAPETIERMLSLALPVQADVVLGKVVSNFPGGQRGVPHEVFRITRPQCTLRDAPLIDSLTPHKMFRREFLREHGIRYPEGKRRLEDQLFMVKAYFAAQAVSIVGDYPCYYYIQRPDLKNAGNTPIEAVGYYTNLREVLDVVVDNTEPGEFRDLHLRRFYRVEMLRRLSEPETFGYNPVHRREIFDEVRAITKDYFGPGVAAGLVGVVRARAALVEQERLDDLVEMAEACTPIHAWAQFDDLTDNGDGTWSIALHAELLGEGDAAVRIVRDGDGHRLVAGGEHRLDVPLTDDDLGVAFADVVIKDRDEMVEWFVPHTLRGGLDGERYVFRGTATLDPQTLHGGRPLPRGSWDLAVRIHAFGLVRRIRFGAVRADGPAWETQHPVAMADGTLVLPYFTDPAGNFSLDVGSRRKPLGKELPRLGDPAVTTSGDAVSVTFPVQAPYDVHGTWTVVLGSGNRDLERRTAELAAGPDGKLAATFAASPPPGARSGWVGFVTSPATSVELVGTWRRSGNGLRVSVDTAARQRAVTLRRGRRGLRARLGRVKRRLTTR